MNKIKVILIIGWLFYFCGMAYGEEEKQTEERIAENWPLIIPGDLDIEFSDTSTNWLIFPGVEMGIGSGTISTAFGLNVGYKNGPFIIGTAIKAQVVNINRVNYIFTPLVINIFGISYTVIPKTSNRRNDKTLEGVYLGYGSRIRFAVGLLSETNLTTTDLNEYLTFTLGMGF